MKNREKILLIGSEGYIGSSLKIFISGSNSIDTCDLLPSTPSSHNYHFQTNYDNLTQDEISQYKIIILLAANSSVNSCIDNPEDAIRNNIVNFMRLLNKMNTAQILIYASSGSVYDGYNDALPSENAQIVKSRNIYDFTKISNDFMASAFEIATVGLRLGTLSGASPKMRNDLIINKMVADAFNQKTIKVSNPSAFRSCLGINDFNRAIMAIINNLEKLNQNTTLFNLSSFNYSIDQISNKISKIIGAKIIYVKDSPTYNFSMSTKKFEDTYSFTFQETIETIVNGLITEPTI